MSLNKNDTLVKHAFNEQKTLNMNWFRRINTLSDLLQSHWETRFNYPCQFKSRLSRLVVGTLRSSWRAKRAVTYIPVARSAAELNVRPGSRGATPSGVKGRSSTEPMAVQKPGSFKGKKVQIQK